MATQRPATSPPPASIARSTLMKMGARIAALIFLTTLFSYLHIFNALRTEALEELSHNVLERAQREQAIFVLAEDNHAVLKTALQEHFEAWRGQPPQAAFERLTTALPDGTLRTRPEGFDGKRQPCIFVPQGMKLDDDMRRWMLAAHEVLSQYAPAFHVRFTDTYVTLPGGAVVLYWPEKPLWCQEVTPDFRSSDFEFFTLSTPAQDPSRHTVWSGIVGDPIAHTWTVSASTPVDHEGQHAITITQDILVEELMSRTINDHLPGAYNLLLRADGQLIAHPELKMEGATEPYNLLQDLPANAPEGFARLAEAGARAHLRRLFDWAFHHPADQVTQEFTQDGEYAAAVRLEGPGWYMVTVLPEHVVSTDALRTARYVLGFGLLSLLLELFIMYWVLRQQISQPLQALTQASARLEAGDFDVSLDASRGDELGRLAQAFQQMAEQIHRREDQLLDANERLEHRVEARTRELQDMHQQLVETARHAGRAEVATNVLHNVGNVLNSVHTSAVLAKERLEGMKLGSLDRMVGLLETHRAELPRFLTEDERGRNVLPFLGRLSKYMQAEQQEMNTLLADVSRHTEHIGAIVKLQQRYARRPQQPVEKVSLAELVEDALRINQAALERHSIRVQRQMAEVSPVLTEKHKVLMILTNLISNAEHALQVREPGERRLEVVLDRPQPERLRLQVRDNGVGIAPDMLTRIFQHGFTTREEGHGFGLHSSALAAQELGGSLLASSEGPDRGATFTLELPAQTDTSTERAHA